jgi:hypothetical protein
VHDLNDTTIDRLPHQRPALGCLLVIVGGALGWWLILSAAAWLRRLLVVALVIALLGPRPAAAHDPWTTSNTILEATFVSAVFLDWQQTRWMLTRSPARFYETNPVLGQHPSIHKLDAMVGAAVAGHALVAFLLPEPFRSGWQLAFVVIETGMVSMNCSVLGGLRFRF